VTRGTMRTLLRRRLNEQTADNWEDTELNDLLNDALLQVQKYVLKVNPEAAIYVDTAHVVADQELYAWPQGFLYEIEVAILDTASNEYEEIDRASWSQTRRREDGATTQYAHHGRHFGLSPVPETSVSAGIRLRWVPSLEMADDADVPEVIPTLHPAIVLWAQKFALGETGDALDELRKEIADVVGDLGEFYRKSVKPTPFTVDVVKGY
jgi:hypothetical protein